jgi:hypothetical protein
MFLCMDLIHKDECFFICTLYKFTFLNRSEPNLAHVSPLVWKISHGTYGPKILDLFELLGPFSLGATAESRAQDDCRRDRFPRYPYISDSTWCSWRHRHDVADCGVIRGSLISVILARVPLTSRKWRSSRRQSHPPQRRIPYSGGCTRHVMDITFKRATRPFATALYPSF